MGNMQKKNPQDFKKKTQKMNEKCYVGWYKKIIELSRYRCYFFIESFCFF